MRKEGPTLLFIIFWHVSFCPPNAHELSCLGLLWNWWHFVATPRIGYEITKEMSSIQCFCLGGFFFWVFSQSGNHPLEDEEKVRITPLERFCQIWLSTKYEEQTHNNLVGRPVLWNASLYWANPKSMYGGIDVPL